MKIEPMKIEVDREDLELALTSTNNWVKEVEEANERLRAALAAPHCQVCGASVASGDGVSYCAAHEPDKETVE